jgi:hypothetical protein
MNDKINIELIIERAMIAFGCESQKQLADLFMISAEDFSNRKRRGTLTKLIEKEAYRNHKSYEWIKTGHGSMKIDKSDAKYLGADESPSNSLPAEPNTQYPDPDHLIRKTAKILRSNTSFCKALDSNIEAFHEAIILREELDATKASLYECQNQIADQRKTMEMMQRKHENEINELRTQMKIMSEKLPPASNET